MKKAVIVGAGFIGLEMAENLHYAGAEVTIVEMNNQKVHKPKVNKDPFGKMFGMMLPSSSLKLKLSKMNMFGVGSRMMRHIMKQKGVDSLESLREQAIAQGVEFIACQMSMDVMGVKREELLNGVTTGGVASYMERAEQANVNLFV